MSEATTKKTPKTSSTKPNTTRGKKPKPSTTPTANDKMAADLLYAEWLRSEIHTTFIHRMALNKVGRDGIIAGAVSLLAGVTTGIVWDFLFGLIPIEQLEASWLTTFLVLLDLVGGVAIVGVVAFLISRRYLKKVEAIEEVYEKHEQELRKELKKLKEE